MNEQPETPMIPATPGPATWFSIWMDALTKPNEQTFARIASSASAKSTTAFLWVFLASLIQIFLVSLVRASFVRGILEQQGLGGNLPVRGVGFTLVSAVCGAPIAAVISVAFFAIGVALIQWIAKMFGGRGTFDQMSYALAAIAAPFSLVATVFNLLGAIPLVGLCFSIVLMLAGIYVLVLDVMAVKGVNQFGWGQAIGSFFIPILAVLLICCCLAGVAAFAFQNVFEQIRQGLNQ